MTGLNVPSVGAGIGGAGTKRKGESSNQAIEYTGAGAGPPGRDNCICTRIADAMLDYCASLF